MAAGVVVQVAISFKKNQSPLFAFDYDIVNQSQQGSSFANV